MHLRFRGFVAKIIRKDGQSEALCPNRVNFDISDKVSHDRYYWLAGGFIVN